MSYNRIFGINRLLMDHPWFPRVTRIIINLEDWFSTVSLSNSDFISKKKAKLNQLQIILSELKFSRILCKLFSVIKDISTNIQLATDWIPMANFWDIDTSVSILVNLWNGWTYNSARVDYCACLINESKGWQDEGVNTLHPFASQREVCKPCFSTIAVWSAFKVHTIQIILFYIGKQRVIVGKYKPYCLINLNFTQNVGLLV